MRTVIKLAPALFLLAACGREAEQPANSAAEVPTAFPPGEWEMTAKVESLVSTDQSTPATTAKVGETSTRKACIADAKALKALFAPEGGDCSALSDYARQGRINTAYSCKVRGGLISPMANGRYTAESFEVQLDTSSQFAGNGDYQLRSTATGRRLGDC